LLNQLVETLAPHALERSVRQGRPPHHVGEDVERRRGVAAENIDGDVRRVPIGAGAKRGTEKAEVFSQLDGVAGAGTLIEKLGGQRR
jgi:hypothetical protein